MDPCLIVGIGSPHGDDQAGWLVADAITSRSDTSPCVRKATVPVQALDWIQSATEVHLVDASDHVETVVRIAMEDDGSMDEIEGMSLRASTHDTGVAEVIHLAKAIGWMPDRLRVWAIPAHQFSPNMPPTEDCRRHVDSCVERLLGEVTSRP